MWAEREGHPSPVGEVATRIITGGGSKDGMASSLALDVDDRIVALNTSGGNIVDQAGPQGYFQRFKDDWQRCGDEVDWKYMPVANANVLAWTRHMPGAEPHLRYWDLYNIAPQYGDRPGEKPIVLWKWSTHDLHYPLGAQQDFWWSSPNFEGLWLRQVISVNHDHGGTYEPGADEPEFMER